MSNPICIKTYFRFKNKKDIKNLDDVLNKKIQDLLDSISHFNILPSKITISINPRIYKIIHMPLRRGKRSLSPKYKFAIAVVLNMDYTVIDESHDQDYIKKCQEIYNGLIALSDTEHIEEYKSLPSKTKSHLLNEKKESISQKAPTKEEARIKAKNQIFEAIKNKIDFKKTPEYTFTFDFKSILKEKNEEGFSVQGTLISSSERSIDINNGR